MPAAAPIAVTATVPGSTRGEFRVTAQGAASYRIPLALPLGAGGLTPTLTLGYDGGVSGGILGQAWSLEGLSIITRCARPKSAGVEARPVRLDVNDRFCIDGRPLVAVRGVYGADGTEYRTEIDEFVKVVSHGTTGFGPESFTVWTKSGQRQDYGSTPTSRIEARTASAPVRAWALARISDTMGNAIAITYAESDTTGEFAPLTIDYTENVSAGRTPQQRVAFTYASGTGPTHFVAGAAVGRTMRLSHVTTMSNDLVVRQWQLTYAMRHGTVPRLSTIRECSSDGSCFAPTTITYATGPAPGATYANWSATGATRTESAYDLDGDRRVDLLRFNPNGAIEVALSTGTSFASFGIWGNGTGGDPTQLTIGDVTGDGLLDVVEFGKTGTVRVWSGLGSAFSAPAIWRIGAETDPKRIELADTDADGRLDMVEYRADGSFRVARSLGQSFGAAEPWGSGHANAPDGLTMIDLDGDRKADAVEVANGKMIVWRSTGQGLLSPEMWATDLGTDTSSMQWGDVNGDGLIDGVRIEKSGAVGVWRNTGTAFSARTSWGSGLTQGGVLVDLNGDGMSDILAAGVTQTTSTATAVLRRYISSATAFVLESSSPLAATRVQASSLNPWKTWVSSSMDFSSGPASVCKDRGFSVATGFSCLGPEYADSAAWRYQGQWTIGWAYPGTWCEYAFSWVDCAHTPLKWQLGDFDGDGLVDIVDLPVGSAPRVSLTQGFGVDQLASVREGNALTYTASYGSLADPTVYAADTTTDIGIRDIRAGAFVVSKSTVSSGTGSVLTTSYRYQGAKMDLFGRGPLGFRVVEKTMPQGSVERTEFMQTHPYMGMPRVHERLSRTYQLLSRSTKTYATLETFPGVVFPYVAAESIVAADLDGSALPATSTSTIVDGFGNPTVVRIETTAPDGTRHVVSTLTTYANDTTMWWLGRATRASTTHSLSGQADITRTVAFTYNDKGRVETETREPDLLTDRIVTRHLYDAFGNETETRVEASGESRSSRVTYDPAGRLPTSRINPAGHAETLVYANARIDSPTSLDDANLVRTTWTYDEFGRKLTETRAGITETITRTNCTSGCPANAVMYVTTARTGAATVTTYFDQHDREVRRAEAATSTANVWIDTGYDALGRVTSRSEPRFSTVTTVWNTTFEYDELGRVTKTTGPDGLVTEQFYAGLLLTMRREGKTTTELKNVLGKTAVSTDGSFVRFIYNATGDVLRVENVSGAVQTNTYDLRGRLVESVDRDHGRRTMGYNSFGELVRVQDAKGQVVTATYDPLGRPLTRVEAEGTIAFVYDTAPMGKGRLASVSTSWGPSRHYGYDSLGRPSSTSLAIDGFMYTLSTTYDTAGRPSVLTYPSGLQLTRLYDPTTGLLAELRDTKANKSLWRATTRNARRAATGVTYGSGLTSTRVFDDKTGMVSEIRVANTSGLVLDKALYGFDRLGNLRTRANASTAYAQTFGYDEQDRLASVTVATYPTPIAYTTAQRDALKIRSSLGGESTNATYAYDTEGNLTYKSDVGSYAYLGGRLHTAGSYTFAHDANGNMTTGAGRSIAWTSFDMPSEISRGATTTRFTYDGEHARVKKDAGSERVLYLPGGVEFVVLPGATEYRHYVDADGELALLYVQRTASGTTTTSQRYFHLDHLGSPVLVTHETGGVVERMGWDPFGARQRATGMLGAAVTSGFDRGFTGHEQLDALGLIHMNARVYDPILGRFLSPDKITQEPGNSQNYSRYSYVFNNPLSATDPSGHFSLRRFFRSILGLAVAFVLTVVLPQLSSVFVGTWGSILTGAVAGAAGGAIAGGTVRSALFGALSGATFAMVGNELAGVTNNGIRSAAHACAGGVLSAIQGGDMLAGALSAGFGEFVGGPGGVGDTARLNRYARGVAAAVAGGTASALSGDGFANGALTTGFGYIFNTYMHETLSPARLRRSVVHGGGSRDPELWNVSERPGRTGLETAQEAMFRLSGDRVGYWTYRQSLDDPYADTALDIVLDRRLGKIANRWLQFQGFVHGKEVDLGKVNIAIMDAHAEQLARFGGHMSPGQFAAYHHVEFARMGLPASTFGGTPFFGMGTALTAPLWHRRAARDFVDMMPNAFP